MLKQNLPLIETNLKKLKRQTFNLTLLNKSKDLKCQTCADKDLVIKKLFELLEESIEIND